MSKRRKRRDTSQIGLQVAAKSAICKHKLKQAYVENNGNVSASAKAIGISAGYAHKLMPDVRRELMEQLDAVGATSSKVARVINDAMDATVGGGDIPDHNIRLRAATFQTKITGAIAPQRSFVAHAHGVIPQQQEPTIVRNRIKILQKFADDLGEPEDANTKMSEQG